MHSLFGKTLASMVFLGASIFLLSPINGLAHATVKPSEVKVGAFQSFNLGVPNEKEIGTTEVRLIIPAGLEYFTANLKAGWEVELKKSGTGKEATVTEVIWKGNKIPAGFREDFAFSAKVPTSETTLAWKAYQTYEDGTIVNWDMDPKPKNDDGHSDNPYSVTRVVNDLNSSSTSSQTTPIKETIKETKSDSTTTAVAYSSLFLALVALGLPFFTGKK